MTLGNKIAFCRKNLNITQDALARQVGVTNQAVSKWESDQCCPDVMLLPKIAEIFGITIDELFGRTPPEKKESGIDQAAECSEKEIPEIEEVAGNTIAEEVFDNTIDDLFQQASQDRKKSGFEKLFGISLRELDKKANQQKRREGSSEAVLPWGDDNILRVVLYVGRRLVGSSPAKPGYEFGLDQNVDGVLSCISVTCGNVNGDVDAGGHVVCGDVNGDVDAGTSVTCGDVHGDVDAGTDVKCGDVDGDVDAGCSVECSNVSGDVDAGGIVNIRQ